MSENQQLIRHPGDISTVIDKDRRKTAIETRLSPMIAASRTRPARTDDDWDLDINAIRQALRRHRVWICVCTLTTVVVAALVCLLMTPQYKAVSRLEVLKQDMDGSSLAGMTNPAGGGYSDPLDFNLTLETQVNVLKSEGLALQVIKELNLADAKEFRPRLSFRTQLSRWLHSGGSDPPSSQAALVRKFSRNLAVEATSGTRLITVSYTHPDPKVAARIVNQLVSDFVEYNFQVRYNATRKATDFLSQQLVDLKSQVEKSQERTVQLQRDSGIFGEDEHHNIIITRLEQLNNEVTAAEADRVIKGAVYKLSREGNPELVVGMVGGIHTEPAALGSTNAVAVLTNLLQQEASLNAEYADAAAKYGPAYPRLIQIKNRLDSVRSSIATEQGKVVDRVKREYELAAWHEAAARKAFAEQKTLAAQMNDKSVDFLIAKHEADSSRSLYEHLLEKLKEADVLAGLHSSQLHIVDSAAVPDRPARPDVPLYLALGAVAGMTVGVFCVFVAHTMDHTVRDVAEIENAEYVPVLGVIPHADLLAVSGPKPRLNPPVWGGRMRATHNALPLRLHNSAVGEAFRSVRTSLLLSQPDEPPKVLMITSGMPQEGKSFVSVNLAATLAHNGSSVLLVDADLRRGTLSGVLNQPCGIGLSQVLLGATDHEAYRRIDDVPGLTFMPAGARSPQPSELLGSQQMAAMIESWRQRFDYVLIDTPPVLPVTDAVVLSPHMDGVVVLVRFGVTNRPSLTRTIRILRDVQAAHLAVLVNAVDVRSPEYYNYSGSHGYDGYHGGESGEFLLVSPAPGSKV
jgi:capsular exopolysaccharide synthesis family protein